LNNTQVHFWINFNKPLLWVFFFILHNSSNFRIDTCYTKLWSLYHESSLTPTLIVGCCLCTFSLNITTLPNIKVVWRNPYRADICCVLCSSEGPCHFVASYDKQTALGTSSNPDAQGVSIRRFYNGFNTLVCSQLYNANFMHSLYNFKFISTKLDPRLSDLTTACYGSLHSDFDYRILRFPCKNTYRTQGGCEKLTEVFSRRHLEFIYCLVWPGICVCIVSDANRLTTVLFKLLHTQ
jgi:hypothetical protein